MKNQKDKDHSNIGFKMTPRDMVQQPVEHFGCASQTFLSQTKSTKAITRSTKRSLRGTSYTFHYISGNNLCFSAKTKFRHPTCSVPITIGPNIHLSSVDFPYLLVPDKNCRSFQLIDNSTKQVLLTYEHYDKQNWLEMAPQTTISLSPQISPLYQKLISKTPILSPKGYWYHDFHQKMTITSTKNSILVSSNDRQGNELFIIRKVKSDMLEMDVDDSFSPIAIFGISLCIFLTKM